MFSILSPVNLDSIMAGIRATFLVATIAQQLHKSFNQLTPRHSFISCPASGFHQISLLFTILSLLFTIDLFRVQCLYSLILSLCEHECVVCLPSRLCSLHVYSPTFSLCDGDLHFKAHQL